MSKTMTSFDYNSLEKSESFRRGTFWEKQFKMAIQIEYDFLASIEVHF